MNYAELIAKKKLIKDGYVVEKQNWNRYGSKDLFNCWDFIAVKNAKVKFIQVSVLYLSERGRQYREKLENFPARNKEYWRYNRSKHKFEIEKIPYEKQKTK